MPDFNFHDIDLLHPEWRYATGVDAASGVAPVTMMPRGTRSVKMELQGGRTL
jgi:hypothetical protein